jgi:hypothetical protein
MEKKAGDELTVEPEDKKELTAEEKDMLKRLEKGELEEPSPKAYDSKNPLNKDPRYAIYSEMGYEVHDKLGLVYRDTETISKQRKVVFYLLKSVGANLLRGKSIMNISLPVTIFDKASLLERSLENYAYAPIFGEKMYAAPDPVEKMKQAVALTIASLHTGLSMKKPFNPILGETCEGKIGHVNAYCEQTSHHPPISHVLLDCEHFRIDAKHQFTLSTYPNSATFKCLGQRRIILKDLAQTTYIIDFPWAECKGFMFGTRIFNFNGIIRIRDKTNKLYAQIRLNAGAKGFAEGLFKKQDVRSDFFKGLITKNKTLLKDMTRKAFYSKDMLSYFEGAWIDHVMIDGDMYWEMGKVQPLPLDRHPSPLPSDSRYRADLQALLAGNEAESQKQKEVLEEFQRNDRKLRDVATKAKAK